MKREELLKEGFLGWLEGFSIYIDSLWDNRIDTGESRSLE